MKKISLPLAFLVLAVSAHAQNFEDTVSVAVKTFAAEDVFADVPACVVLDTKTIRPFTLEEASDLANPCLKAVGQKYQAQLTLQAGLISAATEGRPAKPGLLLKSDVTPGSKTHRDLASSLARREGRVLGHQVRLLTKGEAPPASVSSVQQALSQCILSTVVRDIQTGSDLVKTYGTCLTRNPSLKIDELRPGEGLTVNIKTGQTPAAVEALNGFVTVNAGKGPVQLMIIAYSSQDTLPY